MAMLNPSDRQELDDGVDVSSFGELPRPRREWNGMGTPLKRRAYKRARDGFIICFRSPRTRASRDRGGGRGHHHQQPATCNLGNEMLMTARGMNVFSYQPLQSLR